MLSRRSLFGIAIGASWAGVVAPKAAAKSSLSELHISCAGTLNVNALFPHKRMEEISGDDYVQIDIVETDRPRLPVERIELGRERGRVITLFVDSSSHG